jgi:hypothetical protein
MFEYREQQCPLCKGKFNYRKPADPITYYLRRISDDKYNAFAVQAATNFWALPKSKCKVRGECHLDKRRSYAYGNQLQADIEIAYRFNFSVIYSGTLTIHMDYINAGHAFWHWYSGSCHDGGYSELGFAKFCNWYMMLVGQYLAFNIPKIIYFQKSYGDNSDATKFVVDFLEHLRINLFNRLESKSFGCNAGRDSNQSLHPTHKEIGQEEFKKIIADALILTDMIGNGAGASTISKFVIEKTKNYLYQYRYHLEEISENAIVRHSYSPVMEKKIYGRKIRIS